MFTSRLRPTWSALVLGLLASFGASAQDLGPDCSAAPLVESRISLTWPEVPAADSVAALPPSTATLRVENRSADTVAYELIGHGQVAGERLRVPLGSGVLTSFGAATVPVALDELGVGISALAFSGRLFIESRGHDTTGAFLDRAYSPNLYFHEQPGPTGAAQLVVYGAEALRLFFNYGDLHYQVHTSSAPDPTLLGIFDGGAGDGQLGEGSGGTGGDLPWRPELVGTPPQWEFCMRWIYQSIDSGFGEDHYVAGTLMKARGMKIEIDHANWQEPLTFWCNDDNGCCSFAAAENTGFEVTLFSEARLGGTGNVTVRAYESLAQGNLNDPVHLMQWKFVANPGGEPRRVYYQSDAGELANLMASGSFVFHWVDHQTTPRLSGQRDMVLVPSTCQGGSCQSADLLRIAPGASTRKFLVGHEVGHWLHRQWTDDDMGYDNGTWSANSQDPDCAFNGVGSHAMRSKEYAVGGFIEGFAHYISALAWNDHGSSDGIFKYYKEIDDATYDDMQADNWRVSLEGGGQEALGGPTNWMGSECFVSDGHSVEMDWLRFYWDYRTDAGTQPAHFDLFEHIAFTRMAHPWADNYGAFDQALAAIANPDLGQQYLVNRFIMLAVLNGVGQ